MHHPSAPGGPAGWARHATTAAALAAERSEIWLPGSLASIAFLGWLPFVLALVSVPSAADLEFFGASLASASSFPLNVVVLGVTAFVVLLVASVMVASGEAVLQATVGRLAGTGRPDGSLDATALRLWVVQAVAALPTLAALAVTLVAVRTVAPGEYQSPDIGGSVLVRIARDILPDLVAMGAAVVVGVAYGASAQRAATSGGRSLGSALLTGARDLVRHPVSRLALSVVTLAVLAAWLAATWFVLQLLWQPIGRAMAGGRMGELGPLLLLVGFVGIWLALLAAGGALHGWASAWWSLELTEPDGGHRGAGQAEREDVDRPWT